MTGYDQLWAALLGPPAAIIWGLFVGSYLNVVALRWGRRSSSVGRSTCLRCQRVLSWHELIPVLSFVVQGGSCHGCGHRLSWRYPGVELLTAAVFVLLSTVGITPIHVVWLWIVASLLIVLSLIDWSQGILPDVLTLGGSSILAVFTFAYQLDNLGTYQTAGGYAVWIWGAVTGLSLLGFLVLITRGKGMGLGDVKLAGMIGVTLGGPLTLFALWAAFILGACFGLALIAMRRASWRGTQIPFGPFLAVGWLVAVAWGQQILAWYTIW